MADGFELYTSFGLIDGSIDYILIGSLTVLGAKGGVHACIWLYARMCVLAGSGRTE